MRGTVRAASILALLPLSAVATPVPRPDGLLPGHAPLAAVRTWAVRQSGLCLLATKAAERRLGLPAGTLGAISRVETGVVMPVTGDVQPWPWTLNAGGVGHWYATRDEAVAATGAMLARRGGVDVDVGCMQVSLRYHRDAFGTLSDAFDPATNVAVGARLFAGLRRGRGGVDAASGLYHSATPALGNPYRATVARMRRSQRPTLADAAASRP